MTFYRIIGTWIFLSLLMPLAAQVGKKPATKTDSSAQIRKVQVNTSPTIRKELKIIQNTPILTDVEGNKYKTVKIGNQTWMKENLRTTHFADGSPINYVRENADWIGLNTPAAVWYNHDSAAAKTSGALYNWFAASSGKLCPAGWHVPRIQDWDTLVQYLGGDSIAGDKLKSQTGWMASNSAQPSDLAHFTALPTGWRQQNGLFIEQGRRSTFWTNMQYGSPLYGFYYSMDANRKGFWRSYSPAINGHSVRCIKD